jgi:uncharacterized membrane protein YcaP (DUF421 family)
LAQLEPSGHVSVIKTEAARPLEKQDLKRTDSQKR